MRLSSIILSLSSLWLIGCHATTIAPAEQVEQRLQQPLPAATPMKKDVVKKQRQWHYLCDNNQSLRVQFLNNKKNSPISLSFNRTTYTLSPAVGTQGKKYSNIRWIWSEDFHGIGTLKDNRHKLLASQCVKQPT